jgi:Fe-Mn family superoxide dismutase
MNDRYPFVNTPLPYAYDALEPYIDAQTMRLHHDRHLQTYINNLNAVLKDHPGAQQMTLRQLVTHYDRLPKNIRTPVRNNAGGVYNHRLYFDSLSPRTAHPPRGLAEAIDREYGDINRFHAAFKAAALSVFGSGYAWLCAMPSGRLSIAVSPNQDTPPTRGCCPLLLADVWEHAYYLKHYNQRAAYLDDWARVIDWDAVGERFTECGMTPQKSVRRGL